MPAQQTSSALRSSPRQASASPQTPSTGPQSAQDRRGLWASSSSNPWGPTGASARAHLGPPPPPSGCRQVGPSWCQHMRQDTHQQGQWHPSPVAMGRAQGPTARSAREPQHSGVPSSSSSTPCPAHLPQALLPAHPTAPAWAHRVPQPHTAQDSWGQACLQDSSSSTPLGRTRA
jgi:hypothetical protein